MRFKNIQKSGKELGSGLLLCSCLWAANICQLDSKTSDKAAWWSPFVCHHVAASPALTHHPRLPSKSSHLLVGYGWV